MPEGALVPVQRRIVEWDAAGQPVLTAQPVLTRQHIQSLYLVAAAQPYVIDDPFDPEFGVYDGMTIAEVLVRKQLMKAAKTGEAEMVMDRLIGKPMSRGENVNINATYEQYLKALQAKLAGQPAPPIDVTPEPDDGVFGDLA